MCNAHCGWCAKIGVDLLVTTNQRTMHMGFYASSVEGWS